VGEVYRWEQLSAGRSEGGIYTDTEASGHGKKEGPGITHESVPGPPLFCGIGADGSIELSGSRNNRKNVIRAAFFVRFLGMSI